MTMTNTTDRIEKKTQLKAPRSRVWRAISDAREFEAWFQVKIDGDFAPGARLTGAMTFPGWEGTPWEVVVDRIEPESLFAFRWHPGGDDPHSFPDGEMTLVEFRLEEAAEGTMLTIVESGFDKVSAERRARAFAENDEGWTIQLKALETYVTD